MMGTLGKHAPPLKTETDWIKAAETVFGTDPRLTMETRRGTEFDGSWRAGSIQGAVAQRSLVSRPIRA
jgi:hypothetical protein